MKMKINNKLFEDRDLALAKQFILEKPNPVNRKVVERIGLEMFARILLCPSLSGKHLVFPSNSTLVRMRMIETIKNELSQFVRDSKGFKGHLKKLGKRYRKHPFQILKIYKDKK